MALWQLGASWLGVDLGTTTAPKDHLFKFKIGWNNTQKRISLTVWLAIIWTLWIGRNSLVFRGNQFNYEEALDQVKRHSWTWMNANVKDFCYSFYEWHSNPLACIQGLC
ncbi:uncharacterized protein LOC130710845 [Lotus japonicus]|uniref:uncharacterized protein LOC130710845 n=1 Tax=Lotus japonicus TaxID=34305 RepID=UPI0025840B91|nr:uncharacterized protein LOC130710845 [Lotus japonicus]